MINFKNECVDTIANLAFTDSPQLPILCTLLREQVDIDPRSREQYKHDLRFDVRNFDDEGKSILGIVYTEDKINVGIGYLSDIMETFLDTYKKSIEERGYLLSLSNSSIRLTSGGKSKTMLQILAEMQSTNL